MCVCALLCCLMDRCLFPPSQLLCLPLSIMAGSQMKLSIGLMTFYRPVGNLTHIHVLHATLYHRRRRDLYIMAPLTLLYSISTSPDQAHKAAVSYVTPAFIIDAILTAEREGERQGRRVRNWVRSMGGWGNGEGKEKKGIGDGRKDKWQDVRQKKEAEDRKTDERHSWR